MNQNPHDSFLEDIPAYVLGTLSRSEAAALQAHLATCQICQDELKRYQQIGDGLMGAILPLQTPPSAVKNRLLGSLEEERALVPSPARWSFKQWAFGTIALVLIGMNLISFLQIRDLHREQAQLARQVEKSHTILGMLTASTEIHPVSGEDVSGNLLLDREKNLSYLLVWDLPPLPGDLVYQIWLVGPEGERVEAGWFRPQEDHPFTSAALVTPRAFTEFVRVEVTIEPLGGSNTPTGEQILSAEY
jgi:Anti-sigma-K factor rskA, C-terminal/Putative zinc-finger